MASALALHVLLSLLLALAAAQVPTSCIPCTSLENGYWCSDVQQCVLGNARLSCTLACVATYNADCATAAIASCSASTVSASPSPRPSAQDSTSSTSIIGAIVSVLMCAACGGALCFWAKHKSQQQQQRQVHQQPQHQHQHQQQYQHQQQPQVILYAQHPPAAQRQLQVPAHVIAAPPASPPRAAAPRAVFISHQWSQKPFVERCARVLACHEISYWLDTEQMAAGGSLLEKITHGVHASSLVLVVLSREYINSENCHAEIMLARDYKKPLLVLKLPDVSWPIAPHAGTYAGGVAAAVAGQLWLAVDASGPAPEQELIRALRERGVG